MTTQDYILGCLRFVCDIVNAFIYLSAIATSAIDVNLKIKRNIALIASCYYRLKRLLSDSGIPRAT